MNERLRRRMMLFYMAGVINVGLGMYVLVEGGTFLPRDTVTWLAIFFLAFAGVDFWFPWAMRKKWEAEQARAAQQQPGRAK